MQQTNDKIVVSGIAGVFPNLKDVGEFYTNLDNKIQSFNDVDPYWKILTPGVSSVIGKMPFETKFDAGFFGVHYKQAEQMHPACRMLLELSVEAVMDSGIHPIDLKGSKTGVFMVNSGMEAGNEWVWHKLVSPNFGIVGSTWSTMAEWISYYFQLQGPSVSSDSGCSSSLYALNQAILAIRTGQCDNALICGFNVIQNPYQHFALHQLGVLNTEGNGNVFDDSCNGYIRSEAMTVIFVQKLQNAKRAYAEILNIKINCDGFKNMGSAHPSDKMMASLFQEAYAEVEIDPKSVTFLESHIAGTVVGLCQEIKAIERVFCSDKKTPMLVGSVKANIGHTEGVSGLVSLIKIFVGLQYNCILPNPEYKKLTKHSDALQNGKVVVLTKRVSLPNDEDVIIGCTSFGLGGTNAHVVLKHNNKSQSLEPRNFNRLVCFSARTIVSIKKIINSLGNNPTEDYLALLQNIFRHNIENHWHRAYTVVSNEKAESYVGLCTEKAQLCLIYPQCTKKWLKIAETMHKIPWLTKSIERVRNVFLSKNIDIVQLWTQQPELDFADLSFANIALQIVVTDFLKGLFQERIKYVQGFSSGAIASAYATERLQLENALFLAFELRNRLKKYSTAECVSEKIILTEMKLMCQETNKDFLENTATTITPNVLKVVVGSNESNGEFSFDSNTTLLHMLGRLYILGVDLNLEILYSSTSWPVKAPLISPCIQWQHENNWYVPKFTMRSSSIHVVTIILEHEHWKFLTGHIVDGRIVLPSAAYLSIAWNCYLILNRLIDQTKVLFEDVVFNRLTFLTKQKPLTLTVSFMKKQNKFEINEGNNCLVTGKIRTSATDSNFTNFLREAKPQQTMSTKDIYKKLNLQGYQNTNEFCCLQTASLDGKVGFVKWYNWITFFTSMQHFPLLTKELDGLHIPVKIDLITIDTQKHDQALNDYNNVVPIYYDVDSNMVSTPGVQLRNATFANIKKQSIDEPVLETYKFVPFDTTLSTENSIKVLIQLVVENVCNNILEVIEIVDSFSGNSKLLCPVILDVLKHEYPIDKHFTVYSTKLLDYPNITFANKTIEQLPFDLNLLIVPEGSKRQMIVEQILQKQNCFILSRETHNFKSFMHAEVISSHRTNLETFVLLRRNVEIPKKIIEIKSDLAWLEQLQLTLSKNEKVLLVAQNDSMSGILGLVCCLKQEVGQNVVCAFLINCDKKFDPEDDFYQSQLKKGLLFNVFTNNQWGSYRHLLLNQEQTYCEHVIGLTTNDKLSNVQYVQGSFTKASQENLIRVHYAGINDNDVLMPNGKINLNKQYRSNFGSDFAGEDSNCQKIMGIELSGEFSNLVSIDKSITCPIPHTWSMEDAVTVPTVYLTVLNALLKVARLKHGQSILIHSSTSGIGQAAINIALHYNCQIFATVGSKENRNYLKHLYPGILDCRIGNSHDTSFEQMVLKQTKGRGIDIILNSLADDKLHASLRCLACRGIFIELGKHDDTILLDTFSDGRSYNSITMDSFYDKTTKKKQLLSLLQQGIKAGYVKPLSRVVYHPNEFQEALRYMSLGNQTGKIVVKFKDESANKLLPIKATPRFFCDANKVYILIGGLGGVGIELADWLIQRNAKKLILVSRSGITTGYQNYKLNYWKKLGCKVLVSQDSLTTEEGCAKLLTIANAFGNVAGIFNLAMVLHDALIENQTKNSFNAVLAPKVLITKNIDTFSKIFCPYLRYFVVFSSIVCGRGNSGQTNYGMANSIAERICEQRRKEGYPALAIQWGSIGDVGFVVEKLSTVVPMYGLGKQQISSCLSVMDVFLTQKEPIVSSAVFDHKQVKRRSKSEDMLNTVAEILAITNLKHVSMYTRLSNLGMDSISNAQLKQYLSTECSMHFSVNELRNMTLQMLVEKNNTIKQ
ncbi:hypothetical protein RN001_010682 [Aquatica leii]|uniref:Ketosynthase family 3 (KS3) domain-containing protein n=1 Tax=Aquatica leii TaxID=1421715 RepID=A0AAN7S8N4_9COLE|nr:hypothetical protein RN001_010682 [Aquatica leii]